MIRIFVFGDSISFGKNLRSNNSWPTLLYDKLRKKYSESIYVYNLSIPGNSTSELLNRMENEIRERIGEKYAKEDINIAIISIGINDLKGIGSCKNHYNPQKKFYENYMKIIKKLSEYNFLVMANGIIDVCESKVGILQKEGLFFNNKSVEKYNDIIRFICKKFGIKYIVFNKSNFRKDCYLLDGIHLNSDGQKKYFNSIYKDVIPFIKRFNHYSVLKYIYKLKERDIDFYKDRLIGVDALGIHSPLFVGTNMSNLPERFVGGVCLKKDILGMPLNSMYQLLMPIFLGKLFNRPVGIILPIKEEMNLNKGHEKKYIRLSKVYHKIIKRIENKLHMKIDIIDTYMNKYEDIIEENMQKIKEKDIEYNSMYTLSIDGSNKDYTPERIHLIQRNLSTNCFDSLHRILGDNSFCNVMDIEQFKFYIELNELNQNKKDFMYLGFLPLPNIKFNSTFFKSSLEDNILLGRDIKFYKNTFKNINRESLSFYEEFFSIIKQNMFNNKADGFTTNRNINFKINKMKHNFFRSILRLSNYLPH